MFWRRRLFSGLRQSWGEFTILRSSFLYSLLLLSAISQAEVRDGDLRIHFDTDFFGYSHLNLDGQNAGNINSVGFGLGRPGLIDGGGASIGRTASIGLGGAYVFLGAKAMVGARLVITIDASFIDTGSTVSGQNATFLGGYLVPYFRYLFPGVKSIRPYIEGRMGIGGVTNWSRQYVNEASTLARASVIAPVVGAGGGIHYFFKKAFSVDLGLNFDYQAPHVAALNRRIVPGSTSETRNTWSKFGDMINLSIGVGLSVWLDLKEN